MSRVIHRLLFVSDGPHFGGAERYIIDMASAARRRGIDPHILWIRPAGADRNVFAGAERAGINLTSLDPDSTSNITNLIRSIDGVVHGCAPDGLVINACGRPRIWLVPWIGRRRKLPAVWVHQMIDGRDHRRLSPRWFGGRIEGLSCWRVPQMVRHRLAAWAASAVITLNADDRERVVRWQGVRRSRIRVVPHGVDCERFRFNAAGRERLRAEWGISRQRGSSPLVVGTAGRLVRGKRVDLLIDAAAILQGRGKAIVVAIAGQGQEREALWLRAKQAGLGEAVRFIDFADEMPSFYSALDVFALCSETESFGLALAEAMSCERPCVATPTAGAMRQINHGCSGWQLKGFAPEELADALATMSAVSGGLARTGQSARESVVRQFSIDLTLERTLRALRGTCGNRTTLRWPGMDEARFMHMATEDVA